MMAYTHLKPVFLLTFIQIQIKQIFKTVIRNKVGKQRSTIWQCRICEYISRTVFLTVLFSIIQHVCTIIPIHQNNIINILYILAIHYSVHLIEHSIRTSVFNIIIKSYQPVTQRPLVVAYFHSSNIAHQ